MSSKVFYRFSHEVGTDAKVREITFNGPSIRLGELKRELINKLSVGRGEITGFDLDIRDTDKQTSYPDVESSPVPKNSTILVSRIPLRRGGNNRSSALSVPVVAEPVPEVTSMHDFGDVFAQQQQLEQDLRREEEEVDMIRMIATDAQRLNGTRTVQRRGNAVLPFIPTTVQSGLYTGSVTDFDRTKAIGGRGRGGLGRGGSFVQQQQQQPAKKKTFSGIPKQLLTSLDPDAAMTAPTLEDFTLRGDADAFSQKVQGLSTLGNDELRMRIPLDSVPGGLRCKLSGKLLQDAVRTKCCHEVCSLDALRDALIKSNFTTCPLCGSTAHTSLDDLEPDLKVRQDVDLFLGQEKLLMAQRGAVATISAAREVEELKLPSNNNYDVVLDLRTRSSPVNSATAATVSVKKDEEQPAQIAAEQQERKEEDEYRAPWLAPPLQAANAAVPAATANAAPGLVSNLAPSAEMPWMANMLGPPRFYRGAPLPQTGEVAEAIAAAAVTGACFSWTQSGTCRFANNCRFTHGGQAAKDVDMSHTIREPCYSFERGHCKFGVGCRYDHSLSSNNVVGAMAQPELVPEPLARGGNGGGGRNRSPPSRNRGRDRSQDRKKRRRSLPPMPPQAVAVAAAIAAAQAPPALSTVGKPLYSRNRLSSPPRRRPSPERHHRRRGGGGRRRSRDSRRRR
ncbi:hypothetical protein BASA81_010611 [Batrachochytrium salamandrivorans]|nr:hypothetical protein BASA81_010611 [Batrachochytrium salamandrivorans]